MPRKTNGKGARPRPDRLGADDAAKPPRMDGDLRTREPRRPSNAPPFLVAAVGASAGGLEAFSSLLTAIPGETPLALVLVQHLARDHKSILPELLSNITKLNVFAARDEQKIEPRHVYVIPPDAVMTISDGHLRVRPGSPQRPRDGTVDALFRSMASEYKDRAVGVVLSGSAQDGAAGIREIKAGGGITIAQHPEQAAVDGMPRAAIATGAIDAVLSVEEIAHHLTRLAEHPFFKHDESAVEDTPPDLSVHLQRVFQLVRRATGIDFNNYKIPTLRRRIERRIAFRRLSTLRDYVVELERDPTELARLQEDLLIHVTSFFREPSAYAALEQLVFPTLRGRGRDSPVRVWIPGCSTGEEAYSVAMAALEFLGDKSDTVPLQIFGTDVSESTIEKARAGIYGADIAADVTPERLRRFFTRIDGGYRISKELRDRCVFARQDVSRDPPFSKLDLVVCRNLLIYLNQATQQRVLGIFHYALRPNGFLMLGRSETVGSQGDLFSACDKKAQLYVKKDAARQPEMPSLAPVNALVPARAEKSVPAEAPARSPAHWDPQTDANRFLLEHYAPPAVIVERTGRILRSRGGTAAFLELPSGEVTVDVLKMVHPDLLPGLRAAMQQARSRGGPARKEKQRFNVDGRPRIVDLHVVPIGPTQDGQLLIVFDERSRGSAGRGPRVKPWPLGLRDRSAAALQTQLGETRSQLQSIIDELSAANEELQSANEEILSSNEELQSTNEELDTAKEELQSTNEELSTLNDELHGRNDALATLNSDLTNVLNSVQIPIVIVNRDLRIRRFTPAAGRVMNIIPSDVGRPIGHLKPNFSYPSLETDLSAVIDTVAIREGRIEGTDGKVFAMQIRPYMSIDNRIDGAILVMFDVSGTEDQAAALEVAAATGEALMSTVRDPILLLDRDLRVLSANGAFRERFQIASSQAKGRFVYEIVQEQWNIPALRELLEDVLPKQQNFEGFQAEYYGSDGSQKTLFLDARRIDSGKRRQGVILLVIRG